METELLDAGVAKKVATEADLSAEIARAVEKRPGDRIKVRRVSATMYRVNWVAPETTRGEALQFVQTYRIRDSRFMRAAMVGGKLVVEDMTSEVGRN